MNNLKRRSGLLAVLCVVLCLALLVCSCKKDPENPDETTEAPVVETTEAPVVETTEAPVEETTEAPVVETTTPVEETTEAPAEKATYTVTVKDGAGVAVAGVQVQLCEGDACQLPMTTDAEGKASGEFVVAVYEVSVVKVPEGYELPAAKVAMGADNTATITLKKAEKVEEEVTGTGTATDPFIIAAPEGYADAEEELSLKANESVYYNFTATAPSVIYFFNDGASFTVVINNLTEGKNGAPLTGAGALAVEAKAGCTYQIVVTASADAEAEVAYLVLAQADGSKENPYVIDCEYLTSVDFANATGATIPTGKTVWVVFEGPAGMLLTSKHPSLRVLVNGTTFQPDTVGEITGIPGNTLVGISTISTTEVNPTFTIQFAEGSEQNPIKLTMKDVEDGVSVTVPAGESVWYDYSDVIGYIAYSAAPVTSNTKIGLVGGMFPTFHQIIGFARFGMPVFSVQNDGRVDTTFSFTIESADDLKGIMNQTDPIPLKDLSKAINVPSKIATIVTSEHTSAVFTYTATAAGTYTIKTADDSALNCEDCAFAIQNTNTYAQDTSVEAAAGDVLEFIVNACEDHDWSFKVTFTAAPVVTTAAEVVTTAAEETTEEVVTTAAEETTAEETN